MSEQPRSNPTTIDPRALQFGKIAEQTAEDDSYFTLDESAATIIADLLLDALPEPDRSCVTMVVFKGLSYAEAGELLERDRVVDPKTVWRWTQRGVARLQEAVARLPWAAELVGRGDALPAWDPQGPSFDEALCQPYPVGADDDLTQPGDA